MENDTLHCTYHFKEFHQWIVDDQKVREFICLAGFGPLCTLKFIKLDSALITALSQRWHPETNTFHLPVGEMTITLQDVGVLLGLRVDGPAIVGGYPIGPGQGQFASWATLCDSLLGVHPDRISNGCVLLTWLRSTFGGWDLREVDEEHKIFYTRAYLLHLIGTILLPNSPGNEVHLRFLPFIADFQRCGTYSWGSAALAYLYRQLYISKFDKRIAGCLHLLQLWSWERLHVGRLGAVDVADPYGWPTDAPLGYKWNTLIIRESVPNRNVAFYRNEIDVQQPTQVSWIPYEQHILDMLPPICRDGCEIWLSRVPMVCFTVMEWHMPERVLRQFCFHQDPKAVPDCDRKDGRGRATIDGVAYYQQYLDMWADRRGRVVQPRGPYQPQASYDCYTSEYLTLPSHPPPLYYYPLSYLERDSLETHFKIYEILNSFTSASSTGDYYKAVQDVLALQRALFNRHNIPYTHVADQGSQRRTDNLIISHNT